MATSRKSIRGIFYLTVILVTTLVCGVFGFVNYKIEEERKLTELDELAELTAERLALNLSIPLWNISHGLVTTLVDAELKGPHVRMITVRDEDRQTIVASRYQAEDESLLDAAGRDIATANMISTTSDVMHKSDFVGELGVFVTTERVRKELQEGLINTLILTVLLIVILCAVIAISLNRLVVSPMISLSEIAANMAKGNFRQNIPHIGRGEVGSLSDNLRKMQSSFQIALNKLAQRQGDQ